MIMHAQMWMLGFPQVFLIEVNTSPALFRAGKYLTELLPKVIEEVVQVRQ